MRPFRIAFEQNEPLRRQGSARGTFWADLNAAAGSDRRSSWLIAKVLTAVTLRRPDFCTSFGVPAESMLWSLWSTFRFTGFFQ